jgi:hypothetical protein
MPRSYSFSYAINFLCVCWIVRVEAFPASLKQHGKKKQGPRRTIFNRDGLLESKTFLLNSKPNAKEESDGNANSLHNNKHVKFQAPLLDYGYVPTVQEFQDARLCKKPILLYLPGFDGTYICPFIQFPELGTEFDVWCMTVGMDDRSTFEELRDNVLEFLGNVDDERPVYIAGESFGGILASEVTMILLSSENNNDSLKGLILINPATNYDRSVLQERGQPVAKLPSLLYPFWLMNLLPLFTDEFSFSQLLLILSAKALPSVIDTPAREAYMGRVAFSLPTKLEYMPQETFEWRLNEWLATGCEQMKTTLAELSEVSPLRTLIVAAEKDFTLPSLEEAERLSNLLPNSNVHVVKGAGHASTCGSRVDMAAVIRSQFPELQGAANDKRTTMKKEATDGEGPYFGMTERYDGADVGLNPIQYWSGENYRSTDIRMETSANGRFSTMIYQSQSKTSS